MTAKPLIRIVDDDEALTASSAMLLEAMGWDVAVWHSGGAFLDEADLMRPGCLVLDVRMPGLTGLDVQAELERRGSNLPILFLSAHGSIQMAVHVMRHGAVDFLEKPVEPMTLVQRVAQCVTASLSAKADDAAADEVRRRFDRLTPREREVRLRFAIRKTAAFPDVCSMVKKHTLCPTATASSMRTPLPADPYCFSGAPSRSMYPSAQCCRK